MYLLTLLVLIVDCVVGLEEVCWSVNGVNGSLYANGKCFQLFNITLSWADSREFCRNIFIGGSLAEPVTASERNVTTTLVESSTNGVWLGADDSTTEGSFQWSTSKGILSSADLWWSTGEPSSGQADQDCVLANGNGKIYSRICTDKSQPLCQYSKVSDPPIDPCYPLKGARYINGKCMQLVNLSKDWDNAQASCRALHSEAKLYEMFTQSEKNEVALYVSNCSIDKFWIGAKDLNKIGKFVWETTPDVQVVPNEWIYDEPNDSEHKEDSVAIFQNKLMNDVQSSSTGNFICELPLVNNGSSTICNYSGNEPTFIFKTKCFLFVNSMSNTTSEAQSVCESLQGRLAEPVSYEERQAILSNPYFNPDIMYLIGAGDASFEGDYVWNQNQSTLRLNWWESGRPNSASGLCVSMSTTSGQLSDELCSITMPFLCQLEVPNPCDTILPGAIYSDGQCFKVYKQSLNWSQAQAFCFNTSSTLAEPTSVRMDRALAIYLRSKKTETAWLGGQDIYQNRTFQWSLNESLVSSSLLNISNTTSLDYLVWYKTSDEILYEVRNGTELYNFVCQTAAANPNPQDYIAVLPEMSLDRQSNAFIHVTAGYTSIVVYLNIYNVYDGIIRNTSLHQLIYKTAVELKIPSSQNVYDTYTYSRYVKVHSSQPVAVVLYIMNDNADQASSTLILPNSLYTKSTSFILHSAYPTLYDNTITVVSKASGLTNISFIYDASVNQIRPTFSIGHVQMGAFLTASTVFQAWNEALSLTIRAKLDGSLVFGNQSFGAFLQSKIKTSLTTDHTMDTLIPVDLLDKEYIMIPSEYNFSFKFIIKLVAAHEWTNITIYNPFNGVSGSVILKYVGDSYEQPFTGYFYNIIGNATFYAYRLSVPGKPVCVTSLLPISAWKYQYDIYISPSFSSYMNTFYIHFVVPTEYKDNIETNLKPQWNKSGTIGHPVKPLYTGVTYTLPKQVDKYYHFQLPGKAKPFAAYVYATTLRSAFCHPLGFSLSAEHTTDVFDQQAYIDQLMPQETLQPQATCSVEESTTSFQMENTTFENTGSSDYLPSGSTAFDSTLETTEATTLGAPEDTTLETTDYTTVYTTEHTTFDTTEHTTLETTVHTILDTTGDTTVDTTEHTTTYMPTETTNLDYTAETSMDYGTLDYRLSTMRTYTDIDISDLLIKAKNTSAYRRTLISIQDTRLSSQMIGGFGIIIITCVFTFISLGDLTNLLQFVSKFICNKQKQETSC